MPTTPFRPWRMVHPIEEEEHMPSNMLKIGLWSLMLAAATPSAAQVPVDAPAYHGIECGGQYECIEYKPLPLAEARTSLGYPHTVDHAEGRTSARALTIRPASTEQPFEDASWRQWPPLVDF